MRMYQKGNTAVLSQLSYECYVPNHNTINAEKRFNQMYDINILGECEKCIYVTGDVKYEKNQ